jgi:quercetin dioxygenase-like cupin family protein
MVELVRKDEGLAFADGADRGRILVSGANTGGRYSLMEYVVAPRPAAAASDFGAHLHNEIEETFLVRSGELQFLLGEHVETLRAGDFIRVPPGTRHGYANISGAPVELLVSFHPGGFEQLFVKYRTDGGDPAGGEGFLSEATELHGSKFE